MKRVERRPVPAARVPTGPPVATREYLEVLAACNRHVRVIRTESDEEKRSVSREGPERREDPVRRYRR